MDEAAQDAALGDTELTDLWGVAARLTRRLVAVGIKTPLDLKRADPRFLRERFSVVLERTARELRGIPCIVLEEHVPDRKTVMASRSFGRPVTHLSGMQEAVATYTARAGEKLRRQNLVAPARACKIVGSDHAAAGSAALSFVGRKPG